MAMDLPHYRQFLYFLVLHTIYIYIMIYGNGYACTFPNEFYIQGLDFLYNENKDYNILQPRKSSIHEHDRYIWRDTWNSITWF